MQMFKDWLPQAFLKVHVFTLYVSKAILDIMFLLSVFEDVTLLLYTLLILKSSQFLLRSERLAK